MALVKMAVYAEAAREVRAVAALANETNRLANGYRIDVDEIFKLKF